METFIANVSSPVGPWAVAGTTNALTAIYLPTRPQRPSPGAPPRAVALGVQQLEEYFVGRRREFDVTLADVIATTFQRQVWDALVDIPYGHVRTYGEIANSVGRPQASRAVGNANHVNPWPIVVPCHRVVSATGLGGYGGGDAVKRYLLNLEGGHY